ncbi:WYL domain-containing protein [Saccharopolyspora erythraea]|uniref:helix-turn-helix transcriptional regulator n=1 Tax=Saccharopolyspora erythraea TaxID=1836 RepID=UPI001BA7D939|nr:WYL domain-containing protein [Saccharopolyspora erythraea]QUH05551.1 WYL domain-containing protein [Saccharopolyspora erythraea]
MDAASTRKGMPGRLLRLLSLLQSRREWSGAELADRLGVTDRTVRRDVERLRELDYPVRSTTGTAGGYRLVSGRDLPPLLLDDDEAVAVAIGLATADNRSVAGIEESSMRALAKLEQVLPARLRPRLAAVTGATAAAPHRHPTPRVDPAVLAVLAACCRDREILSFDYRGRGGEPSARRVEPHHLVTVQGFWYLLAHDPDREDWRTFRVDRIERPSPTRRHHEPRELPAPDPATYLTRSFASARYTYTARISVALSAEEVRVGLFAPLPGDIEDRGTRRCTVRVSAESPELVTQYVAAVAALGAEYSLDAPDEIVRRVRELGRRLSG